MTSRPVQTRFRCAFASRLELATKTNSLTHYAKGTPSPAPASEDPGRAPTVGRHPVSGSVSLPALGCFSPFPHGTGALSVTEEYLGLEGGPPTFGQDFSCPALLADPCSPLPVPGCHRLWRAVPDASGSQAEATGLVRVRSPLLAESRPRPRRAGRPCCCPFLRLLRWFSSPGSPRAAMDSPHDTPKGWVAPFGHPRITGRSPLPSAFRSVPRPSSPLGTKASTRCPCRAAPAPSPQHARRAQAARRAVAPTNARVQRSDARGRRSQGSAPGHAAELFCFSDLRSLIPDLRDRGAHGSPCRCSRIGLTHTHAPGPTSSPPHG